CVSLMSSRVFSFFFFHDSPTTHLYTLSLHDALPILSSSIRIIRTLLYILNIWWWDTEIETRWTNISAWQKNSWQKTPPKMDIIRSEEHTSELQSRENLVCRLLLEKKKKQKK